MRDDPHLFTQLFLVLRKLAEILAHEIRKFPIDVFPHGKKGNETSI